VIGGATSPDAESREGGIALQLLPPPLPLLNEEVAVRAGERCRKKLVGSENALAIPSALFQEPKFQTFELNGSLVLIHLGPQYQRWYCSLYLFTSMLEPTTTRSLTIQRSHKPLITTALRLEGS
jgi:hypothetical protein